MEVLQESGGRWNSAAGRLRLREIARGDETLAGLAAAVRLAESERDMLARSLAARRRATPRSAALDPAQWARSIALELDYLRRLEVDRALAVERFDARGFRGNRQHLERLFQSMGSPSSQTRWNRWRRRERHVRPDLRGARLTGLDLRWLNLNRIRLEGGDLSGSVLRLCNLSGADLRRVHMRHTDLSHASLRSASLRDASVEASFLVHTDLSQADLRGATLIECLLNRANLESVKLKGAVVWGIGAWDLRNTDAARHQCRVVVGGDLDPDDYDPRVLRKGAHSLAVDNLETAHVIELLANNDKIGDVLRAAAGRLVLVLGRFEGDQGHVLDALKAELPKYAYAPIKYDFDQGPDRDLVETVTTLASLSRFVIADLTQPRSVPLETQAIVPDIAVPFVPIIQGQRPFSMFSSLQRKYFWVLPTVVYRSEANLIRNLDRTVIQPAERMVARLRRLKCADS